MRLTTAIVVTGVCSAIGTVWGKPLLWLPYSGFVASIVELSTRDWVASDRLGSAVAASTLLKFFFALVGLFAMVAQLASVLLLAYWVVA